MPPELTAIIGIVAFLLATGLLVAGLMAYWSNSSRQSRREEYRPPHYDDGGQVRFGPTPEPPQLEEGRPEADPFHRAGGIVWGREEVFEPARPARIRTPAADEALTKCPTCRLLFSETPDQVVLRCANCRTLVHQRCKDEIGDCPICHGKRFTQYQ